MGFRFLHEGFSCGIVPATRVALYRDDCGKLVLPALRENEDGPIPPDVDDCHPADLCAGYSVAGCDCFRERAGSRLTRHAASGHGGARGATAAGHRPFVAGTVSWR